MRAIIWDLSALIYRFYISVGFSIHISDHSSDPLTSPKQINVTNEKHQSTQWFPPLPLLTVQPCTCGAWGYPVQSHQWSKRHRFRWREQNHFKSMLVLHRGWSPEREEGELFSSSSKPLGFSSSSSSSKFQAIWFTDFFCSCYVSPQKVSVEWKRVREEEDHREDKAKMKYEESSVLYCNRQKHLHLKYCFLYETELWK